MAVQAYGKAKLVKKVNAGSFHPKPRVDSAVLLINSISSEFFTKNNITEETYFAVLKSGFAHKRKKLSSNLKDIFPKTDWTSVFSRLNLDLNIRPEELTLDIWAELSKQI
jgi:16S rRNA (adenine1518-N6/adenine1519-N6)-dimethyltransferase